jgi:hypothetical protein
MAVSPVRRPFDELELVLALDEIEDVLEAWRAGELAAAAAAHHVFRLGARAVNAVGDCHR